MAHEFPVAVRHKLLQTAIHCLLYFYFTTVSLKSYSTFFIQQVKDSKFSFNEVNTRLVVMEVDEGPSDLLTHVFILLQFEHMLQHTQQHSTASLNIQLTISTRHMEHHTITQTVTLVNCKQAIFHYISSNNFLTPLSPFAVANGFVRH